MATYRIWPSTDGPSSSVTDGQPLNLATEFQVTPGPAWITHLHFYRAALDIVGPVVARLWVVDSAVAGTEVTGTEVTFTLAGVGWQTVALPAPVAVDPAKRYKINASFPDRWTLTGGYWSSGPGASGHVNGPLTVFSDASAVNGQGSYAAGPPGTYPNNPGVGGNYWLDVTVTDDDPNAGEQQLAPDGIASAATTGAPSVTPDAVAVIPDGIAATAALGAPAASAGVVAVSPTSITSAAILGAPDVAVGAVAITPTGVAPAAAPGAPEASIEAVAITPTGIASVAAIGTPSVSPVTDVHPDPIAATSASGSPTLEPGAVLVAPAAIASAAMLGAPTVANAGARSDPLPLVVGQPRVDWVLGILEAV